MKRGLSRRLVLHAAAAKTAAIVIYALIGFLVVPHVLERRLVERAHSAGWALTLGDVSTNPFTLRIEASDLEIMPLSPRAATDSLSIAKVSLDLSSASIFRRAWVLSSVAIERPVLSLVVNELGGSEATLAQSTPPALPTLPPLPTLVIESIVIENGGVELIDARAADGMRYSVAPVRIRVQELNTFGKHGGRYELSAGLPHNAALAIVGNVTLDPLSSQGAASVENFDLASLATIVVRDSGSVAVGGRLSASFAYTLRQRDASVEAALRKLNASAHELSLRTRGEDTPMLALARLEFANASVAFDQRFVKLDRFAAHRGHFEAVVDAGGGLNFEQIATAFAPDDAPGERASAPWRVDVAAAEIDEVDLRFSSHAPSVPSAASAGDAMLRASLSAEIGAGKVVAAARDLQFSAAPVSVGTFGADAPALTFARIELAGGTISTLDRKLRAQRASLSDGSLSVARTARGDLRLGTAPAAELGESAGSQPPDASEAADSASSGPWRVSANELSVENFAVRYVDHSLPVPARFEAESISAQLGVALTFSQPFSTEISDLELEAHKLAATPLDSEDPAAALDALAIVDASVRSDAHAIVARAVRLTGLTGSVARSRTGMLRLTSGGGPPPITRDQAEAATAASVAPGLREQPWTVRIDRIEASASGLRYRDETFTVPLAIEIAKANAELGVEVRADRTGSVSVRGLGASLEKVSAGSGESRDPVRIARLVLEGGQIDSAERSFKAVGIKADDINLALSHGGANGIELSGDLAKLFPQSVADGGESASVPWHYDIGTIRIADAQVALEERGLVDQPIRYAVEIDATLRHLRRGAGEPVRFEATAVTAQGGRARIEGTAPQDLRSAAARLALENIALAPLSPLVQKHAYLEIMSGRATAHAEVTYIAEQSGRPLLLVKGAFGATDVVVNETAGHEPFASWKSLGVKGIEWSLSPNRVQIAEVEVHAPEAKLIVSEKRTLNLTRVLKNRKEGAAGAREGAEPIPVQIGRVRFVDGNLQFADLSLVLPFSTRVHALNGVLVGVSSAADNRTELELTGKIANYGYARARGNFNASAPTEHMDIAVKFDNVLVPPLSPYTATFAGRTIDSGRLWLDLVYRIEEGSLAGESKIVLQDVELGERVEAPDAADLPLELALALLEDSKGRVTLEIPVSGEIGNPKFDYGRVIRSAIANTLRRIASAPFRALAALFRGQDAERVRNVRFEAGSDELPSPEQQQLLRLAEALKARPALELAVYGPYDPEIDTLALREELVRERIAAALGRPVPPGNKADPVAFGDPGTQRALRAMMLETLGAEGYREFRSRNQTQARAYYLAEFAELVARQHLPESRLKMLAVDRANAIAAQLVTAGLAPERINSAEIRAVDSTEPSIVTARLDLRARSD